MSASIKPGWSARKTDSSVIKPGWSAPKTDSSVIKPGWSASKFVDPVESTILPPPSTKLSFKEAGKLLDEIENHGKRKIRLGPEGLADAHHNNLLQDAMGDGISPGPETHLYAGACLLMESRRQTKAERLEKMNRIKQSKREAMEERKRSSMKQNF